MKTGEMIDALKHGEVGKVTNRMLEGKQVMKCEDGIYRCDDKGNPVSHSPLIISSETCEYSWKIESKYVTFYEAMGADKEGKITNFHSEDHSICTGTATHPLKHTWLGNYSLRELVDGKWTIQD